MIRSWIRILQTDVQSTVVSNGYISEWFNISRSLCQGDPISFLHIIMIEILGLKLRADTQIERIGSGPNPKLHAQFADDIWAAIKYHEDSLNRLMVIFKNLWSSLSHNQF